MEELRREVLRVLEKPVRAGEVVRALASKGYDPRDVRRVLAELVRSGAAEKRPDYGARVFLLSRRS